MQALSASDILQVWERGHDKHPVDRALLLLAQVYPTQPSQVLQQLTIGERNVLLLGMRQKTLGAVAHCLATCPECQAPLEFAIDTSTLVPEDASKSARISELSATHAERAARVETLVVDQFRIRFRLPTSLDIAAVTGIDDVQASRDLLIERCILQAEQDSQVIAALHLPDHVIQKLAQAMLEHDPQAEIAIVLDCAMCEYSWTTFFDIVTFFWSEIESQAKRLLRDVHTLATAYGWREADILALSSRRRQFYLELVRHD